MLDIFLWGLVLGLFIGAALGLLTSSLLKMAKKGERDDREYYGHPDA